jgi:hypothetical protein
MTVNAFKLYTAAALWAALALLLPAVALEPVSTVAAPASTWLA